MDQLLHCGVPVIKEEGCWRCGECGRTGCEEPDKSKDTDFIKAVREIESSINA